MLVRPQYGAAQRDVMMAMKAVVLHDVRLVPVLDLRAEVGWDCCDA